MLSASASGGEALLAPGAPLLLDYGRRPMREFLHTFGFVPSCDNSLRECYELPRADGASCTEVLVVETAPPPHDADAAGSQACPSPFCLAEVELARRADSNGDGEGEGEGGEPHFEIRYFVRRRLGAKSRDLNQSSVDAQSRRVLERCRRRHGEGSVSGTLLGKQAGEDGLTLSEILGHACSRLLDEQLGDGAVSRKAGGGGSGGSSAGGSGGVADWGGFGGEDGSTDAGAARIDDHAPNTAIAASYVRERAELVRRVARDLE